MMRNSPVVTRQQKPFYLLLLTLIVLSMGVIPSYADTTVSINADKQFQYAGQLYAQKKYVTAIVAFERFVHFFPEDARIPEARYHIGMAYYSERRFHEAIQAFKDLSETTGPWSDFYPRSFFMAAESQLRLGRQSLALATLHQLSALSDDVDVKDEVSFRIGWMFLEMAEWEKAQTYFQKISPSNHIKYQLAELNRNLEVAGSIHHKSPGLAGALAILPGAGYLYCNRPRDALISFLINGGLIYAAYEAFDNDLYAIGGVISFVEIGFYTGNIYGSISSAHKYNQDQNRKFVDRLRENLKVNLSSRPENRGLELTFQYRF